MSEALEDGVYLHLPFETYLAQPDTKGSTDKGRMHSLGAGFWWASPMNPYWKPKQNDYQLEGEAIHALLLEGLAAYEERFAVEPSKADYPDALFTIPQIKEALAEAGIKLKGVSDFTKADWDDAAIIHLPNRRVWAKITAGFDYRRRGRKWLDAETDFQIRAMWGAATADTPETEEVREVLGSNSGFPVLAEVSVLYHDEAGVRHRARFDKLLPSATVDLKSVGNWQGRDLKHSLDDIIKRNAYDIQAADYQIARREGMRMVLEDEGRLFGGTTEERAHLLAMAHHDQTHRPSWAWLFFQKPDSTGRAPILFPLVDEWGGRYHRSGYRKRHRAMALYNDCMARFGPTTPWSRVEPIHYSHEDYEPHITQSHWGFDDDPVDGESDHFG